MKLKKIGRTIKPIYVVFIIILSLLAIFGSKARRVYLDSLTLSASSVGDIKLEVSQGPTPEILTVNISMRTGVDQDKLEKMSTLAFRLKMNSVKNPQVVNEKGEAASSLVPDPGLIAGGDWDFPLNKISSENGETVVDFIGINKNLDGYSSYEYKNLATFYLKGVQENDLNFEFDESFSKMFSKSRPVTSIWSFSSN